MRQSRTGPCRNTGGNHLRLSLILLCFSLVVLVAATAASVRAEGVEEISVGAQWRYLMGTQELPSGWTSVDFDHSDWPSGYSGFGYGEGDDVTALLDGLPSSSPVNLVRHPYLQMPTPDGVTIVWATRESGTPMVRYGLDWTAPGFDDSGWLSGASGLGYGDGDDATVLSDMQGNYASVYARRNFTVAAPGAVTGMALSMDYDDGFVAYLNGVEVARSNVSGVQVAHRATASSPREASAGDTDPQPVDQFDLAPFVHLLRPGDSILAVQGHNVELNSSDFSLAPQLALFTREATSVISAGDEWRYFKGVEEPLALTSTATGTSAFYSALGGYYQHQVTLEGLLPGSRYSYRVLVDDAGLGAGDRLSFRTAPDAPHFAFVAFGDSGTAGANQLAVRDRLAQDRFDLALVTGDVAYERGEYAELQRTFFDVYGELLKYVPFVPVTGNHDYLTRSAQPFLDMFALPRNGAPGLEERFFSFDYANAHFVALDTEQIGPTQAEWLERDLEANRQFWTIVYFHRTPFGEGSNHPITEAGATQVRAQFVPIFEKHGVDLVLAGHNHIYGRSVRLLGGRADLPYAHAPIDNGIVDYGVVYVTTGGGGNNLDRAYTDRFFQSPGATFSAHHYTRVSIADCLLALQAIDRGGNVRDSFTMDRC